MSEVSNTAKDSKAVKFFKGVRAEFKKIIWPERDTLVKQLIAVLAVTIVVGVIITLVDFGFQNLVDFLTQLSI